MLFPARINKIKKREVHTVRKTKTQSKKLPRLNRRVLLQSVARARAAQRRGAIEQAAHLLRYWGIQHERGDSLIIAPRYKVVIAFDSDDLLEGVTKHAKIIDSQVVHIPAHLFRKPTQFRQAISNAVNRKPVYAGQGPGKCSKTRTNKNFDSVLNSA